MPSATRYLPQDYTSLSTVCLTVTYDQRPRPRRACTRADWNTDVTWTWLNMVCKTHRCHVRRYVLCHMDKCQQSTTRESAA